MTSLADLLQAATPGPWRSDDYWRNEEWYGGHVTVRQTPERFGQGFPVFNDDEQQALADARLIALTPELAAVAIAADALFTTSEIHLTVESEDEFRRFSELAKAIADALAALNQRLAE